MQSKWGKPRNRRGARGMKRCGRRSGRRSNYCPDLGPELRPGIKSFGMGFGSSISLAVLVMAALLFHPHGMQVEHYAQLPLLLTGVSVFFLQNHTVAAMTRSKFKDLREQNRQ